ncbi:APC family permease [Boudabousia marimammalium]|uniref:Amino acid permease n=1 Tax=Boudabousia marimammalium TaxID=156892 RepID=A0A1Q5PT08_9ACTO|nr:APC family permease [Boudabousia marimammalium]OKL50575.1 amino acid permease [Boudabousia marimammalium]
METQSTSAPQSGQMVKSLSLWNYFTMGFGAIIGTGWVLLVGDWMIMGGGPLSAMIAFLIGALFLLPIGATFGELTAAIPISGGIVEYADRAFGPLAGHFTGWFLVLGNAILCPWEAIAISALLSSMWAQLPWLNWMNSVELYRVAGSPIYLYPTIISVSICLLVIHLNFKGAKSAAKLGGFLSKALLTGMVLAMAISLFKGSPANLTPIFEAIPADASGSAAEVSTQAGNFWYGILAVLVITPFFYAGFDTIPQSAEEASADLNWKKFGWIIAAALLASGAFYMLCIYAFGTIMPWTEAVTHPVPALSTLAFISMWFYLPMLLIATIGPVGPMNAFFGASARIMLAMGRKQYLPGSFAKVDEKSGTPKTANLVLAVATLIGPFLGGNLLIPLTEVSSFSFVLACSMAAASCLRLRYTEPDLPRPYQVPGGKVGIGLAVLFGGIIIALQVLPFSPAALKPVSWMIIAGWVILGIIVKRLAHHAS